MEHKNKLLGLTSELTDQATPLVSEVSANFFADRGSHMSSLMDPQGLRFLNRSHYIYFQVAP
jgi:hypothetical protein